MNSPKLPGTDSIEQLAAFWDSHDLTDFEHELEEAPETIFVRTPRKCLTIELKPSEARELENVARAQGIAAEIVLRRWILDRLHRNSLANRPTPTKRPKTRRS